MSGIPTTPNMRSGLPTPSSASRRISPSHAGLSPSIDSPDTRFKKQTLAEAISNNDPAKYRLSGSSPSVASPGGGREDVDSDGNSPLLVAGRLPRASLISRRSHSSLRSDTPPTRLAPLPKGSPSAGSETSPGSSSSIARSKSPFAPAAITTRSVAVPKRYSDMHARGSYTPSLVSRTPSHTSSTAASRAKETVRRGRELEIGDLVRMEGSELVGVLRHLGPVQFKPGFYAGLELTGDSVGKGKNDGSVQGTQYFACAPGNGVFCPASKVVAINDSPPTDAVARPASSMSNRPSSRASDLPDRQGAITPSRRRASTVSRPPSETPSRASSRISVRPPSTTPASRPASVLSTSRPASRLAARKSLAGTASRQADDEDTSRHQASKIGQTSPVRAPAPSASSTATRTPRTSLAGARATSSVLQSTPSMAKKRQSLGGIPTPRATKGRASMFARPGGIPSATDSGMPPPPSPTKDGRAGGASSVLSMRSSSRLGRDASDLENSPGSRQDTNAISDSNLEKNRMLLEQMDLTPRKSAQLAAARSQSRAESRAGLHDDLTHDSVAEAVVPLSLYEDQVADYDKLRLQLQELEKQNAELRRAQEARKARASEVRSNEAILEAERVKMRAEARDRQAEMEEERRLERADELRRRKEIEERERELRDKMSKKDDDHQRYQQEAESRQKSLQVKLEASEQLVKEMKDRIEHESARGESQETLQTQLQLKDAEIDSLKSSLRRLEEEAQASRDALSRQIDELKDAGRETISLYEQRIEEIDSERIEVLENMQLLQDKAQEAIRAAETRVEELQAALSSQQSRGGSLEAGSAAAIDNAALREQVAHLQDKLGKYEDQISEAALNLEKEKEYAQKRRDKSHEVETSLKNELKRMRVEAERAQRASKEQLAQLEETRHALQESQHALERERAELEGLRLDAENFNALKSGPESLAASGAAAAEWRSEMAKLEAELARQKEDKAAELGARDDEIRRLRMQLEKAGPTAGEAERSPRSPDANRLSTASIGSTSSYLKSSNRMSSNGAYAASEASAASSANQMSGLSYLVRQLSDENNDMKTKHRLLESELKARVQEAETKSRTLELTVESLRQQLDARQDGQDGVADTSMLAEKLATSEARLQSSETTLADLRSTLEATKMERKETADSLQKEVSQLESLVEARIFREEELMAEVERLSRKLDERSPARRFSKLEPEATKAAEPVRAEAAKAPVATGSSSRDAPAPSTAIPAQGEAEPCDDCGEVGHRFEDCPYAAEIF